MNYMDVPSLLGAQCLLGIFFHTQNTESEEILCNGSVCNARIYT